MRERHSFNDIVINQDGDKKKLKYVNREFRGKPES